MLDWMGFPSVRNMSDDERDANDERVARAAAAISTRIAFPVIVDPALADDEWYCTDCRAESES